mmetsp:Transcript_23081/g.44117  ORF Transcript_23081/g.44117 Transcript_23081/m.44117 type:complete len:231 (-) Transcript_23081:871-1563(-)
MGAHGHPLCSTIRALSRLQFFRAPDPLVLHLQLVHDGHLSHWTGVPDSDAHAAQRLRQVPPRGGRRGGAGPRALGGVWLEACARGRLPPAGAAHAAVGAHRYGVPAHAAAALRHPAGDRGHALRRPRHHRHRVHRVLRPHLLRLRIRRGGIFFAQRGTRLDSVHAAYGHAVPRHVLRDCLLSEHHRHLLPLARRRSLRHHGGGVFDLGVRVVPACAGRHCDWTQLVWGCG